MRTLLLLARAFRRVKIVLARFCGGSFADAPVGVQQLSRAEGHPAGVQRAAENSSVTLGELLFSFRRGEQAVGLEMAIADLQRSGHRRWG